MRIARFAAAALAVFALAGCDINTGPAKPAQVGCNCTTPPPAPGSPPAYEPPSYEPPVPHTHWRYRTHRYETGGVHGYAWRREYAELSVETYDYRSSSHSYVTGESGDGYAYGGSYAGGGAHGRGWVDGYGRAHGGETADAPVHAEVADRARAAVWRGYDIDCPDDRRR